MAPIAPYPRSTLRTILRTHVPAKNPQLSPSLDSLAYIAFLAHLKRLARETRAVAAEDGALRGKGGKGRVGKAQSYLSPFNIALLTIGHGRLDDHHTRRHSSAADLDTASSVGESNLPWYKRGNNTITYFFTPSDIQSLSTAPSHRSTQAMQVDAVERELFNWAADRRCTRKFVHGSWRRVR
ncbi:hypothetical protein JCM8097_008335 [Rhodosporidiobolus ruineniae]